jgi:hypothetical protein
MSDGQDDVITLDCEKCRLETVFPHENLTDETLLICSHCGADHGTWGALREQVSPLIDNLASDIGGEKFDLLSNFTPKKII